MINTPLEIELERLKQGAILYFSDAEKLRTGDPHYHILLNHSPEKDDSLIFVVATTQRENLVRRAKRFHYKKGTLVAVSSKEVGGLFPKNSYFNCNDPLPPYSKNTIVKKKNTKKKVIRGQISDPIIIQKLVDAVCSSNRVAPKIKRLINRNA